MDGHPIPRQITTFEFKLIGFMTIRQFLYLVVSIPLAYVIIQIFPIPLLNILLGVIVAGLGIATAFMPIKDRTLDVWAKNIWKRLQQPTQYYYHKKNDPLYFLRDLYFLADPHHMLAHVESKEKLSQYLAMTKQRPRANYQKKQVNTLLHTPSDVLQKSTAPVVPMTGAPQLQAAPAAPSYPMGGVGSVKVDEPLAPKSAPIGETQVIPPAPASEPTAPIATSQNVQMPIAVSKPSTGSPQSPISVSVEPDIPQQQVAVTSPAVPSPVVVPPAPVVVSPAPIPPAPVPMPSAPVMPAPAPQVMQQPKPAPVMPQATVIPPTQPFFAGVVKTAKRIPLPGVLIYVKDQQGNPLRILKTNPHGVFATYQPLPAGEYTFEIKDPNGTYFFDTMNHSIADQNPDPFEFQSKELL